ncbi:8-amino-7-oxononanoate synthase [Sphingomonas sp.]|uniref:8-amino-7-oxononanoate synthase n=1 Tax=Sphingomonas sp. TaxID=28214 RepID=UPI002B8A639B|nr:8-amino-7-oxononanoate synthase [Sphingomonas sp.]HTG38266.1 8-amino-7-oxononanoate synthase [Sphingomonas sp.]
MLLAQLADLEALTAIGRRRSLAPRAGADFASNDYLGLAGSPRLARAASDAIARGVAVGSGGSRLLRGNHTEIEALEHEAAAHFGHPAALWFSSGYVANLTLFATLPQRGDLIVHDEHVHASAHDGMRLSRGERRTAAHNDAQAFDDAIADWRRAGGTGTPWIAVESLYSMDGDRAPLADLVQVAMRHDAMLVVDEAHATGVFGDGGRGLAHDLPADRVIALHTCGKAMGAEGALLTGPAAMRDFIINRGRGFIFSTAPSPIMAAVVRESLRAIADEPERGAALWDRIAHAERRLSRVGVTATGSQILPLILGDDARAMAVAGAVQAAGFDVRGIRPPTVPAGTARLRISITNNVGPDDIDALADVLEALS